MSGIVTIDGVEYDIEKLSEGVKHALHEITITEDKIRQAELDMHRAEMMKVGFTQLLKDELDKYNSGE